MDSRGMPCAWARGTWGVPFEGTQAIVSLQLLTFLRRFQVILKYCRTTQARYFAMTSSREPSRPMTNRLLRSAVNCPSSTEPLNCRRHLVKDTLCVLQLGRGDRGSRVERPQDQVGEEHRSVA